MKSQKTVEVLLYKHPLKNERETVEVTSGTFRKIHKDLNLERPIDSYIILDGDTIVKNYSTTPSSDKIYIRATLEGADFDNEEVGQAGKDIGTAAMFVGILLIGLAATVATGGTALLVFGAIFAISGMAVAGAGYWLYTQDYAGDATGQQSNYSAKQAPSIKGGRNTMRTNQKVPVLLGRHLVVPWYGALPYASFTDIDIWDANIGVGNPTLLQNSKYQFLNMLMGNTYAHADDHIDSVKIGEIPFSTYQEQSVNDAIIEFEENATVPTYYPERVKQEDHNLPIKRGDTTEYSSPITYTRVTATDTHAVDLVFLFPQGLYGLRNGSFSTGSVQFEVYWKGAGEPDSAYVGIRDSSYLVNQAYVSVSGLRKETCRFIIRKEFDNNTPASSEYVADRQYVFKIRRLAEDDTESTRADEETRRNSTMYLESIKSYIGTFDDVNAPETWPVLASDKVNINMASVLMKATDALNGAVNNINYEMTQHMPVYSGVGSGPSSWTYGASRNPASAFMYVLTNEFVNQDPILAVDYEDRIDYPAIETWYTFCDDWNLQVNAYIVNDISVESLLKNICSNGFASWNVLDNKYTVYIDTFNSEVTQLFTPRNSYDYSGSKTFNETPTGMKVTFINSHIKDTTPTASASDGGFIEEVRYVYADYTGRGTSDDPLTTDIIHDMNIFGAVDPEQAWRIGRYVLACTRLRPEIHTFSADVEHIMCTRWDRIKLQHDVPLLGLSAGRVIAPVESGGDTIGFASDEIIQYEVGKSYGVQLRFSNGTIANYTVQNLETDSRSVLFNTPLTGVDLINEDDLFAFGETGSETLDLIITKIEAQDNESAVISCVEYNEAVYDAWQEPSVNIPEFNSRVANGGTGTGSISINTLPSTQDETNELNTTLTTDSSRVDYRVSAVSPTGYAITGEAGFYPNILEREGTVDSVIYVNYEDGNTIHTQYVSQNAVSTALNTVSSKHPKYYNSGTQILYINVEDNGGSLYLKSALDSLDGSKVYDGTFYDFAINPDDDHVFIWDDTSIYELDDTFTLVNTFAVSILDMAFTDENSVFYIKRSDGFIYSNTSSFDTEVAFYNDDVSLQVEYASTLRDLYFLKSGDLYIYRKGIDEVDTSSATSIPFGMASAGSFAVTSGGNLVYSNNQANVFFYTTENNTLFNPELEGETFTHSFLGDTTLGSEIILNVDAGDLNIISVGDALVGTNIPTGARISLLGNSYVVMTLAAIGTEVGASIGATGSRIVLNANKVIVPGSIEARLLSASAINSKARDDNGDFISEFDLDLGTMIYRNQAGDKILDFDPQRLDDELRVDGNITAKSLTCTDINGNVVLDFSNESSGIEINTGNVITETVQKSNGGLFPFMNYPTTSANGGIDIRTGIGSIRKLAVCESDILLLSSDSAGVVLSHTFGATSRQVLNDTPLRTLNYLGDGLFLYDFGTAVYYKNINAATSPGSGGTLYLNSVLSKMEWTDLGVLLFNHSGSIYSKPFPDTNPSSYGTVLIAGSNPCYVGGGQMIYLNATEDAFYLKSIDDTDPGILIVNLADGGPASQAVYIGDGSIIYSNSSITSYIKSIYGTPTPADPGEPFLTGTSASIMYYLGGGKIVIPSPISDIYTIYRVRPNYI